MRNLQSMVGRRIYRRGKKMKYRVRFDGYVDIEKDDAEEAYHVVESKFDKMDQESRGEDGISVIDVYNFEAEEME